MAKSHGGHGVSKKPTVSVISEIDNNNNNPSDKFNSKQIQQQHHQHMKINQCENVESENVPERKNREKQINLVGVSSNDRVRGHHQNVINMYPGYNGGHSNRQPYNNNGSTQSIQ